MKWTVSVRHTHHMISIVIHGFTPVTSFTFEQHFALCLQSTDVFMHSCIHWHSS